MFNHFTLEWVDFKSAIDNRHLQWGYFERPDRYRIFGMEGSFLFLTTILKDSGSDQLDFENNYKSNVTETLKNVISGIDETGNVKCITLNGDKIKVESAPASGSIQEMVIVDPLDNNKKANVDPSGRVQVSTQTPAPPSNTTPVIETVDGSLGNNAKSNTYYQIPDGETHIIQRLSVSGEGGANDGWFFELYYDPNGVGGATSNVQPSWELISLIVVSENGGSDFFDIGTAEFLGNTSNRIVLRRSRRGGGGVKRGFIQFSGYIE